MAERIAAHARPPAAPPGTTVEAGAGLAAALDGADGACVLVDGLGRGSPPRCTGRRVGRRAGAAPRGAGERCWREVDASPARPRGRAADRGRRGGGPGRAAGRRRLARAGSTCSARPRSASPRRPTRVELVVAGRAAGAGAGRSPARRGDLRRHGDARVRPGRADHAVNVMAGGPPDWLRDALRAALDDDAGALPRRARRRAALAALPRPRRRRGRADQRRRRGALAAARGAAPALAACVHPGFTEAEAALRAHGVPVARVLRDPERDFALDPARRPRRGRPRRRRQPGSPTGTLDPAARAPGAAPARARRRRRRGVHGPRPRRAGQPRRASASTT